MRAWLFQDSRQKKKLGDDTPWSVGWYDPEGIRRSKTMGSKSAAEKYLRKIEGQLAAGTYRTDARKKWEDFRTEYEAKIANGMTPQNRRCTLDALKHFERIAKPKRLASIKTQTIDAFVAERRKERGKKPGSTISPASVNKELRHLKAVLRVAHEWKYLPEMPRIRMVKEPKKLARYVIPEHFAAMYQVCDAAELPDDQPYPAADWWRALLTFNYMTGWRIGEPLALRRGDLDMDGAKAIMRSEDNKGRREESVPLHSIVVEHLRKIPGFGEHVFPWNEDRRVLYAQFHKIQQAAGINLPCRGDHEHTPACHLYGFHDLRRAFATVNAPTLTADALQALMRHKTYSTTQRYINMARQLDHAVESLHVPDVLKAGRSA